MGAFDDITRRLNACAKGMLTPRGFQMTGMWPEAMAYVRENWRKAYDATYLTRDAQSADGYLHSAEERLKELDDRFDDLASDPLD